MNNKPKLFTSLSPGLLHLYDVSNSIIVIVDILRATSTIATALYNGARCVIPVDSVSRCIELGKQLDAVTAGERDGIIAEGLSYGNSPFEYGRKFIEGKTLVLTTTNGTRLLQMALEKGAKEIVTGSFNNFSSVCEYLLAENKNVILGCAAWKDKINLEDTLFTGAVISKISQHFSVRCDSSLIAVSIYKSAGKNLFNFMKKNNASHYHRLMGFGLEKDIRYCLKADVADILPVYREGKLVVK